ncbi:acyl-CoA thioesterase/bile acid-CoA:amino acid N-acyltransferase family protein [Streptomyces sp. NPDC014894]|uniref:acyl-CoA thioesterase/bile acid-CoA:amino acid N-acyltransferase family protein n=1 Tax=unclassified Streptomyces TaxID=2593676 RepID=UPI0036FA6B1F
MKHGGYTGLWGALVLALLATGCANGSDDGDRTSDKAVIEVDRPTALADEPVRIKITGLHAGERITVTSKADDHEGNAWAGKAVFTADRRGTVDLAQDRPDSGTYRSADGMGLFWSMNPVNGDDPNASTFHATSPDRERSYPVRIAVESDGRAIAERELTRTWMREGVRSRALVFSRDKVIGRLLTPAKGAPRRAPVLLFGGSEGGAAPATDAALLASRGHPTLLLCYFDCRSSDTPAILKNVPLEYFATAARLLAREPGVDAGRMVAMGTSRGTEPAQLLAQHYPDLIRDAVVYAPTDEVVGAFPEKGAAWTLGGEPVPEGPIPYDRMRGAVLAIAGGQDTLWQARDYAESIAARRGTREPHRALVHPEAGHLVGSYPHVPTGISIVHPLTGDVTPMGGSRPADARARAASWPQVLDFLGR